MSKLRSHGANNLSEQRSHCRQQYLRQWMRRWTVQELRHRQRRRNGDLRSYTMLYQPGLLNRRRSWLGHLSFLWGGHIQHPNVRRAQ
jgi:hypothetical protein